MDIERVRQLLGELHSVRVGVVGDFCVDAYWYIHECQPQYSVETGKLTYCMHEQRYGLGGAGNVAGNLRALGVGTVKAFAVVGDDLFGRELGRLLRLTGVAVENVLMQRHEWQTSVYAKPISDQEEERIDFGRHNTLLKSTEDALCARFRAALSELDALIVVNQLVSGFFTTDVVRVLNSLAAHHPGKLFALNTRFGVDAYRSFLTWQNDEEVAGVFGTEKTFDEENLRMCAHNIFLKQHMPVVITRGEAGMLGYDGHAFVDVPGIAMEGPLDPTGAGDTGLAVMTALLCTEASFAEALELANFAAAGTVRKLQQTGVMTPAELIEQVEKHPLIQSHVQPLE